MAGRSSNATSTRDRLLLAAGQLLHEAGGGPVSTRAICERAGVQAPTLYHHFGSKQGLLDAVVNYGFTQYVQAPAAEGDPVDRIRAGWDRHVEYGLENPRFYVLLYGQIEPGVPCNLTSSAEAMLLELFTPLARDGRLRVEAEEAARQFAAANSGVTLSLIAQPEDRRDLAMSVQVRESVLAGLLAGPPAEDSSVGGLAVALSTALADDVEQLTTTERQLLREWLHRLAS
ncbi:TetR/AcrR family transcriptional regulator [Amycolatopsis australiensis]|uniref:DNA-binding transcriptional regulator, AcrR family n=1 Tax=Amycolatopsis australiensis TaxID=546364 RepID=A0A1K1RAM3_9PSEU|nr:TetR/AcrR family transcriptional regulator [Amycolatopsis australiensis]SFW68859.1 DNA-binding transcriptional regulator, AcrR family [Amycolatopsis australiensis]